MGRPLSFTYTFSDAARASSLIPFSHAGHVVSGEKLPMPRGPATWSTMIVVPGKAATRSMASPSCVWKHHRSKERPYFSSSAKPLRNSGMRMTCTSLAPPLMAASSTTASPCLTPFTSGISEYARRVRSTSGWRRFALGTMPPQSPGEASWTPCAMRASPTGLMASSGSVPAHPASRKTVSTTRWPGAPAPSLRMSRRSSSPMYGMSKMTCRFVKQFTAGSWFAARPPRKDWATNAGRWR
mmetsp:Transcript_7847/g.22051  ORF Transcript_7847/g.22051 Transcript_7847/m.22051 type:complete len:240 (+) Transcript_7847:374-1093(+)